MHWAPKPPSIVRLSKDIASYSSKNAIFKSLSWLAYWGQRQKRVRKILLLPWPMCSSILLEKKFPNFFRKTTRIPTFGFSRKMSCFVGRLLIFLENYKRQPHDFWCILFGDAWASSYSFSANLPPKPSWKQLEKSIFKFWQLFLKGPNLH